jgi:hypothetical protein
MVGSYNADFSSSPSAPTSSCSGISTSPDGCAYQSSKEKQHISPDHYQFHLKTTNLGRKTFH